MSIAQHSVAGEGDVRPLPADSLSNSTDGDALVEFTCDSSNLPWAIFRAAHRATHIRGLSARARALLAALARTVDADRPYAAIFARRELLTGRAMQSMRTFYRSLDDLESAGFITRAPQKRYGAAGLFGRAYLHLTEKAAQLLGLVATEQVVAAVKPDSTAESGNEQAADTSFEHRSATVADGAIYKDLYPVTQKRQPGSLPADLQRLLSLGFRKYFVFKLMRHAKASGKILSDVVNACWEQIKTARAPIAYVQALLASPTDFSFLVRSRADAASAAQSTADEDARLRRIAARAAGQNFYDRVVELRLTVAPDGLSLTVQRSDEARPRVSAGDWWKAFGQAVEAGALRPETEALTAQFELNRAHTMSANSHPSRCRLAHGAPQRVPSEGIPPTAVPREITGLITEQLAAMKRLLRSQVAVA